MKNKTQRIVISALFASLVCVTTMLVQIPSPLKGYLNLGDAIVLLSAWLLSPVYGAVAAGLGSALSDLFSGYVTYAPATFIIKGAMALIAYAIASRLGKKHKPLTARLCGGIAAELTMILGYYLFESVLYGFGASLVNIPANAVQAIAGLSVGILLITLFEKQGVHNALK